MKVRILRYWLVLLAVCLVLCGAIFVRRAKGAGPFKVNSNVDASDANPGDGVCATAANACTLRAAIQEVNKLGGAQGPVIITFDLGGGGNIMPTSGLPFITSPVIIDGATGGTRRVQLIGTNAGSAFGLVLGTGSGGSQVSSLVIRNFSIDGLVVGSNGNTIRDCYIGTDFFGTVKQANGNDGIRIDGSNNSIGGTTTNAGNLISGNSRYGVHIDLTTAQGNQIQGNYIGTDNTGAADLGNGNSGIVIRGPFNTIGGNSAQARNVISGNDAYGVDVEGSAASNTTVQGNYIGTNAAGTVAIGNSLGGLLVIDAPFNTIGGTTGTAGNLISGNNSIGLWLTRSGHNVIQGNLIGTDKTGTLALPNGADAGLSVAASADNIIGGTVTGARNLISGNNGYGVLISGLTSTGNQLQGNYIGSDVTGTSALGNGNNGVTVGDSAANNTIGGTTAGAGNVISGNKVEGILFTQGAGNNLVQGNFIGTNAAGSSAIGNVQNGVKILGSPNITIGGLAAGARNVISGNGSNGVLVNSDGLNPTKVQGNYIGTDATGSVALGNVAAGVALFTANNIIGGTTLQARNVISGNGREGVYITAIGNYVQGNFIGTNAAGTAALGNTLDGVKMDGAPSTFVGGTEAGARNVISGNHGAGLTIFGAGASSNIMQGNFIGTDVTGTVALGNFAGGLDILGGPNNTVGGTVSGAGNVISGNKSEGLEIFGTSATKNIVQGNFIGTDVSGTIALANNFQGVKLTFADDNTIGGTAAGAGNLISGNNGDGIEIFTALTSTGNKVQGNFIGTNVSGKSALGNRDYGVEIQEGVSNNLIGGVETGARNVISGNGLYGVTVFLAGSGNRVQGNFIGTDLTGNAALGNKGGGMFIVNTPNTTMGGSTPGARNVISGNGSDGIVISGPSTSGDLIQGNLIGTGANLTTAMGNKGNGVFLSGTSNASVDSGNVIAYNAGAGVLLTVTSSTATDNAILGNSIFSNGKLGIDLNDDGVTPNDPSDVDTGPNNLQNYPVITSARTNASNATTNLQVTLNSTPNTNFLIQYFSSAAPDASGYGEGQTYRGFDLVTTDGSGNVSFSAILLGLTPFGHVITATASDPSHNTSEFSRAVAVDAFTISGNITNSTDTSGIQGVNVSLSGSQTATTQTDANGNYSFVAQAGGNYTVTPSKTNFTFNPPSQTFSNLGANASANFVGTATPQGPTIFVEEGTLNQAVALDSVTHVHGPFQILTEHNFSADHHTRVILFTSDLGLSQPDPSKLTVTAGGTFLTIENVGPFPDISGLAASYIVVRLPDGLPPGDLSLVVTLNGLASTNSPTIAISP